MQSKPFRVLIGVAFKFLAVINLRDGRQRTMSNRPVIGAFGVTIINEAELIFALDVETQCLFYATETVSRIQAMSLVPTDASSCDTFIQGAVLRLKQRWLAMHVDKSTFRQNLICVSHDSLVLVSLGEGRYRRRGNKPAIGAVSAIIINEAELVFALDVEAQCLLYTPVRVPDGRVSVILTVSLDSSNKSLCDSLIWGPARELKQRWLALHVDYSNMEEKVLICVAFKWLAVIHFSDGRRTKRKNKPVIGAAGITVINEADGSVYYALNNTIFYVTYRYESFGRKTKQLKNFEDDSEVKFIAIFGPHLYSLISRNNAASELCMIDIRTNRSISMTTSLNSREGQLELDSITQLYMSELN